MITAFLILLFTVPTIGILVVALWILATRKKKEPMLVIDCMGLLVTIYRTVNVTRKEGQEHREYLKKSSHGKITAYFIDEIKVGGLVIGYSLQYIDNLLKSKSS